MASVVHLGCEMLVDHDCMDVAAAYFEHTLDGHADLPLSGRMEAGGSVGDDDGTTIVGIILFESGKKLVQDVLLARIDRQCIFGPLAISASLPQTVVVAQDDLAILVVQAGTACANGGLGQAGDYAAQGQLPVRNPGIGLGDTTSMIVLPSRQGFDMTGR